MIVLKFLLALLLAALGLFAVYILFLTVCALLVTQKEYTHNNRFYRALLCRSSAAALRFLRVRVHVSGTELLPHGGRLLFVGNHRSNFDPIVQWTVLPQWEIAFISKEGNFHIPFFGRFIRKCCFLSIDRRSPKKSVETMRKAASLLESGEVSVGVYPEGTRSKSGELLPLHCGMFRIAQKAGAPIAVMAIRGTEQIHKNVLRRHTDVYLDILRVLPAEHVASMQTRDIGTEVERLLRSNLYGEPKQSLGQPVTDEA